MQSLTLCSLPTSACLLDSIHPPPSTLTPSANDYCVTVCILYARTDTLLPASLPTLQLPTTLSCLGPWRCMSPCMQTPTSTHASTICSACLSDCLPFLPTHTQLPGSLEVYEPLDNRWTISFPLSKWPAEGGLSGPFPSPPSFAASGLNGLDKKRA
jgi:hypothetical protein